MALLCVLIYIILISACGCFFLRRWEMAQVLLFPAGFMIGSTLMGGGIFLLVTIGHLTPIYVGLLVTGAFVLGIFGASTMLRSLKAIKNFLCSQVYTGKYRLVLVILILIGLALYFADAYTPPRSADAMRYHLAQIKDTVRHSGFVYRPYFHYNFPQYFHYLFTPVFMAVGGVGVQLAVYFYFVLAVLATLYLSVRTEQTKQLLFLALFLVFTPVCIRAATTVNNDLVLVFYGLLGLLLIMEFEAKRQIRYLAIAYISLGFALGCKYQAVLYLPLYVLMTFLVVRRQWKSPLKYAIIIPLIAISFLIASPFFIRNLHYTGAPLWPLLQNVFHVQKDYLYCVTQAAANRQSGHLGFATLVRSIMRLATYVHIIPTIWILWGGYYFIRSSWGRFYKIAALLYFGSWFLVQPKIHPRFAIYIFPIAAIMAISFCEWCGNKKSRLGKLPHIIVALSIVVGMGILISYSADFLRYHVTRNLKQHHQSTWFYEQYQWINQHLKDDSKILVIVGSSHTYYLDKEYLRAGPDLSGLIDWPAIQSVEELRDLLRKLHVRYIFYEDMNWSRMPGGNNMMWLIHDLREGTEGAVLLDDDVKLITSRTFRKFRTVRVFLLDLQGAAKPTSKRAGNFIPVIRES